MSQEISYDEKSGVYKIHVNGLISAEDILDSIDQLKRRGVAGSLVYILIDTMRETSDLSILDVDKVLEALPGKKRFRSAILTSDNHINLPEQKLLEKTAAVQGKAIRVFTDREEALQWLLNP